MVYNRLVKIKQRNLHLYIVEKWNHKEKRTLKFEKWSLVVLFWLMIYYYLSE